MKSFALGSPERRFQCPAEFLGDEAKAGPTSEESADDVGAHDRGQAQEDANVGAVQDDLDVAAGREGERVAAGQQKVRDGALHGPEGSEQPHRARNEVEKLEEPKRALSRAEQGSRRSEKRITPGAPNRDRSFGSLDGADARAPARCDDVDVVPFAR